MTWRQYEQGLDERIGKLWQAVPPGRCRALPSRQVYIPKADGKQHPLGIAALEDKIVQQAVMTVLASIYEANFIGFSHGFRPGRNHRQAVDAVVVGMQTKRVNWVLDAHVKAYFDTVDHAWMLPFLEQRIGDARVMQAAHRDPDQPRESLITKVVALASQHAGRGRARQGAHGASTSTSSAMSAGKNRPTNA